MVADDLSTTTTENEGKEGGEVQKTGTDKSCSLPRVIITSFLQWAITKPTLIKLGFVAGRVFAVHN